MRSAALPPCLAESLRLSGQYRSLRPPPRRLEGSAFQPVRRRFYTTDALREGGAFPHDRRRSRRSPPTGSRIIWTTLGLALAGSNGQPGDGKPSPYDTVQLFLGRHTSLCGEVIFMEHFYREVLHKDHLTAQASVSSQK